MAQKRDHVVGLCSCIATAQLAGKVPVGLGEAHQTVLNLATPPSLLSVYPALPNSLLIFSHTNISKSMPIQLHFRVCFHEDQTNTTTLEELAVTCTCAKPGGEDARFTVPDLLGRKELTVFFFSPFKMRYKNCTLNTEKVEREIQYIFGNVATLQHWCYSGWHIAPGKVFFNILPWNL